MKQELSKQIRILGIYQDDTVNYKKIGLFVAFPYCSMKCNLECGEEVCQNKSLLEKETQLVSIKTLLDLYTNDILVHSLILGGMEPLDSITDVISLIVSFREISNDDIVIYTGYKEDEEPVIRLIDIMKTNDITNVIIKFGRFIPHQEKHYDEILGIYLASDNQYGKYVL